MIQVLEIKFKELIYINNCFNLEAINFHIICIEKYILIGVPKIVEHIMDNYK